MWETLIFKIQTYFLTFITGAVILLIGSALGMLVKKLVVRVLQEIELNRIFQHARVFSNRENVIGNICAAVIYFMTLRFFLDYLGVKSLVLYLFAGALLLLIILTFLVGLKDVIPNLIGRIFLQRRGITQGSLIKLQEISGIVEKRGYLETQIKTKQGDVLHVPNSLFLRSPYRLHH